MNRESIQTLLKIYDLASSITRTPLTELWGTSEDIKKMVMDVLISELGEDAEMYINKLKGKRTDLPDISDLLPLE